jgi:hypothetical protein
MNIDKIKKLFLKKNPTILHSNLRTVLFQEGVVMSSVILDSPSMIATFLTVAVLQNVFFK